MRFSHRWWVLFSVVLPLLVGFAPPAQVPVIDMSVDAGFDSRFRDGAWLPVTVRVSNEGDSMVGRLVVRPETSGAAITNTFSAPVNLPNGASQTVTFYITARGFATQVRVELIDDNGAIVAAEPADVRAMQPLDRLYAVVSQSAAGTMDMTSAVLGNNAAYQANWQLADVPEHASALNAIDVLVFSDVDTSGLGTGQRNAIEDWLNAGGHLVVTGGAGWEQTAAGIADLLPLQPIGSESISDVNALAAWVEMPDALAGESVIATGDLSERARVLVASNDLSLLVRHEMGEGTVDYLAIDPNTAALRGWAGWGRLWLTLQTTEDLRPGWSRGFSNWDEASRAIEILPGFNLLPDVLPLCAFLALYIALIGPANYFILARLNRRELAWITIPALIILFSALSWLLGFNLRGTEATVSRLSVVRTWPESERARVDTLVGLLSPRRAQYDLTLTDGSTLRPLPRASDTSFITTNVQASVEVEQTDVFAANDFAVDASFMAGFDATGVIDKPAIGGSATMAYNEEGLQQVRGSVRNDSDRTLVNPVILARGVAIRLDEPLAPGDTTPFEFLLSDDGPPAPLFATSGVGSRFSAVTYSSFNAFTSGQTVVDLLGQNRFRPSDPMTPEREELERRRLFLASFMNDFNLSSNMGANVTTARGDHVYLAGWTEEAPLDVALEGAPWNSKDTTLYLIELVVEHQKPVRAVTIRPEQFTWYVDAQSGIGEIAPMSLNLQPGDNLSFQFTPLPEAVLDDVHLLTVRMSRTNIGTSILPVYLYNWITGVWDQIDLEQGESQIDDPAPYLGPENAVRVRLNADDVGGYLRLDRLTVEQMGQF